MGSRNGSRPEQLEYLSLSYRLGPNEGWVRCAAQPFCAFHIRASSARSRRCCGERNWPHGSNLDLLAHDRVLYWAGLAIRGSLLASLKEVGQIQRVAFAKELYARGYIVDVPSVVPREPGPWY
jgi:hypothetical protein